MKTDLLIEKIKNIYDILEKDEFPELCGYLDNMLRDYIYGEYDIANDILRCDNDKDLPEFVRSFVMELFEDELKNGNADAANDIGAQYYCGNRGFEQDFSKAVHYYTIAAENGCRQSQENLGYCYLYGRNVPIDYEKAFHYFALGAFDGHLISLYKIGDMYANGYYVKKNEKEAFHIYEYCIDIMTEEAAKNVAGPVFLRLGKCHLYGLGTEIDYEKALMCYQKAEILLYDMVKDGDVMYRKSLLAAIDGQKKAREKLAEELPEKLWLDGIKD